MRKTGVRKYRKPHTVEQPPLRNPPHLPFEGGIVKEGFWQKTGVFTYFASDEFWVKGSFLFFPMILLWFSKICLLAVE